METLTADTANSRPREAQLITRARMPRSHPLRKERERERGQRLEQDCHTEEISAARD